MANKRGNIGGRDDFPKEGIEEAFQALPPLGSPEYLAHIQLTCAAALPPELLAKAFRQLPPETDAATATLERLLTKRGTRWDYLGPMVAYARRRSGSHGRDSYEDLLHDGVRRILEVLPTPRGAYAEQSWHSFCRRELSEAWREKYGRRGERVPPDDPLEYASGDEPEDLFAVASEVPPWHPTLAPTQLKAIEGVARRVIEEIEDDFVRAVANASWFADERPAVSGSRKEAEGVRALTSTFDGKSRHQIKRALRHADSQLAAALLAACDLEWNADLQALLERLRGSRRPVEARVRGL